MPETMMEKMKKSIINQLPARTRQVYQYCLDSDPSCVTVSIAHEEGQFGVGRATVKKHMDALVKSGLLQMRYEDKESDDWLDSYLQAGDKGCRGVYAVKGYSLRHTTDRKVGRKELDDHMHPDVPRNVRLAIKHKTAKCDVCGSNSSAPCIRSKEIIFVDPKNKNKTETRYEVKCVPCASRAGWDLTTTCVMTDTFVNPLK